jgi:hypothetical protein
VAILKKPTAEDLSFPPSCLNSSGITIDTLASKLWGENVSNEGFFRLPFDYEMKAH